MKIQLSKEEYESSKQVIKDCLRGEMCKILKTEDVLTGKTSYAFDTDVITGWSFLSDNSYHGVDDNTTWRRAGLGVFLLIQFTDTPDGGCTLEFTDDLNPDLL